MARVSDQITFRLTPDIARLLTQKGQDAGVSCHEYARSLVLSALAETDTKGRRDESDKLCEGVATAVAMLRQLASVPQELGGIKTLLHDRSAAPPSNDNVQLSLQQLAHSLAAVAHQRTDEEAFLVSLGQQVQELSHAHAQEVSQLQIALQGFDEQLVKLTTLASDLEQVKTSLDGSTTLDTVRGRLADELSRLRAAVQALTRSYQEHGQPALDRLADEVVGLREDLATVFAALLVRTGMPPVEATAFVKDRLLQ